MLKNIVKRVADITISLLMIILLLPLLAVLGILIKVKLGSPIIFVQERPGKNCKIFKMFKFRSMTDEKCENGELLADHHRLTKFGMWLRRSSLDELPELFNIFKGEMSFVGPRPLLVRYLERYDDEQIRRHDVSPGLTGWAQVNGRNAISWVDKFKFDVWYVDNWTLFVDIKILFMTVKSVFIKEGISQDGHVTSEEFKGKD